MEATAIDTITRIEGLDAGGRKRNQILFMCCIGSAATSILASNCSEHVVVERWF